MTATARAIGLVAVGAALLGAGQRPPDLADVTGIRVFDHGRYTRVVVEVSRPVEYAVGSVGSPARLYIDIDDTWIVAPLREPRLDAGTELRQVRGGQNTLHKARVVIELDDLGRQRRTFHLYDPFRIVTDVFTSEPESFDARPVRRVVIDPGHGGKDPGALGARGVREKDVVLTVSRELRARLEREGLEVFLTRDSDAYLTLEKRTERANQLAADVFVSIHANAAPNRRTEGVETYLLDTRYDRQTARVAARENGTTIDRLEPLQKILASLRLGYNERFAARLADDVHDSLVGRLRGRHRGVRDLGVKRGPFLVLFMADMPAILVELGFVTHRDEARRLASRDYARAAAAGIAAGILRYRDAHGRSLVAGR